MDYKNILEGVVNIIKKSENSDIAFVSINSYLIKCCPELLQSEDERIRTKLLNLLKELLEFGGVAQDTWSMNDCKQFIAWLEKQAEQKPVISGDALREGIAHFGITQYQIDNWLKKYVDVEK